MKNYKEILESAVRNEVEAYEFYKGAAEKVAEENLKSTFEDLAKEELKHKALLEGYLKEPPEALKFDETKDYKVAETMDERSLSTDMEFKDAIALAMKREEEAMDMYQQFADSSEDPAQKETFEELAKMEQGHKTRLEEIYTNVAFIEAW